MDIAFDRYLDNDGLADAISTLAAAHPDLIRVDSLGLSYEGRDIPVLVLTNASTGADTDKPAFWIDANIHATEVTASMAALYVAAALLDRYGDDDQVTRILDEQCLYIVPRLNPDGAARALATPPEFLRSGTRSFPFPERQDGLHPEDIDGDGRILQMRVPDPSGDWRISDHDPRLMIKRRPDEEGGEYYRVFPEGRIENFDGHLVKLARPERSLDFNRNFPINWRPDGEQFGAGDFPGSEAEIRAVLRFMAEHPNIFGALTFHTYSRAILRPFSDRSDDEMDSADKWVYDAIGERGTELTGYPNVSVFHHFRYHPKETISGVFDDWMYSHRGIFAFTVELWDLPTAAGIAEKNEKKQFIEWMRKHPVEDDLKIFDFIQQNAPEYIVPWSAFDHPQLGAIEIGGFQSMYTWRNPPPSLLEAEIAPQADFTIAFCALAPRLAWRTVEASSLGDGAWRILAVVENVGFLSTSGSTRARATGSARPVRLEIEASADVQLISGSPRIDVGHLEGRSNKLAGGWFSNSATDNRGKAEWVVKGGPGAVVRIVARAERAGSLQMDVTLGETLGES